MRCLRNRKVRSQNDRLELNSTMGSALYMSSEKAQSLDPVTQLNHKGYRTTNQKADAPPR